MSHSGLNCAPFITDVTMVFCVTSHLTKPLCSQSSVQGCGNLFSGRGRPLTPGQRDIKASQLLVSAHEVFSDFMSAAQPAETLMLRSGFSLTLPPSFLSARFCFCTLEETLIWTPLAAEERSRCCLINGGKERERERWLTTGTPLS